MIITSQNDIPTYTHNGLKTKKAEENMKSMKRKHKEADVIMPQQVQKAINDGYRNVKVIFDDTDMFILLLHYYQ